MNTALIKSALTGILLTLATFAFGRNPPSHVRPNPGGGYTITTPGQPTTIVRPNPVGGGDSCSHVLLDLQQPALKGFMNSLKMHNPNFYGVPRR